MKVSVLHLLSAGKGVGAARKAIRILAKHLNPEIFEVHISALPDKERIEYEEYKKEGLKLYSPSTGEELISFIRDNDVRILHAHRAGNEPPPIQFGVRAKVPILVQTNIFGLVDLSQVFWRIDYSLFLSKMTLLRYQKLIGIPPATLSRNHGVLYYPIDFTEVEVARSGGENFRRELGIPDGAPVVGCMARKDVGKWSFTLVRAARRVISEVSETKFLLVGAPEGVRKFAREKGLEDYFIFSEEIPPSEVHRFYNTIDIFAHFPKIGESFGYVLADAMAYGKPVVMHSSPMRDNAQLELVEHGKCGFITNSWRACAKALVILLKSEQLRREMGLNAHRRAKQLFDADKIARILEKLYIHLLLEKGRNSELASQLRRLCPSYRHVPLPESRMEEFESFYERSLTRGWGCGLRYGGEVLAWRFITRSPHPRIRRTLYYPLQGLFSFLCSPSLREKSALNATDIFRRAIYGLRGKEAT
jgi:glycosyltransferase involved in cell wall biosynthesis